MTTPALFFGLFLLQSAPPTGGDVSQFAVRPEESRFTIKVGRAGFLKMFGHDHLIEVRRYSGDVRWLPDTKESSSVRLDIESRSLTVVGEVKEDDRAKIQADMETKVLEVDRYANIVFESKELELNGNQDGAYRATVRGELTLHGVTRSIDVPMRLEIREDRLRATGEVKIKGSDFGIEPVTVAGGTVKTKDELELKFDLVAVSEKNGDSHHFY